MDTFRQCRGVLATCGLGIVLIGACAIPTSEPTELGADAGIESALPDAALPDVALPDAAPDAPEVIVQPAPAFAAAVAAGPTQSVVVWVDERNADFDIYASRIDANGQTLDPGGIAISTQAGNEHRPDVAWTGDHYLISWMDRRGTGTRIYAARLDVDGTLLDPNGFPLSADGDFSQLPKVSSSASGSLVTYEGPCGNNCTGVLAVHVDALGTASSPTIVAATGREPAIANDGNDFLIVYTDYRNGAADLYARRLDDSGSLLGTELTISVASQSQLMPSVVAGESGYLIAWADTRNGLLEHFWSYLDGQNQLGAETALAATVRWQDPPEASFADGHFMLVWTENDASSGMVETHLGRIAEVGGSFVEDIIAQMSSPSTGTDDKRPSLACATLCTLAWHEPYQAERSVVGFLATANGQPMSSDPNLWATEIATVE